MAIKAVVFDIGGILEITPRQQVRINTKWEQKLKLEKGALGEKLGDVWLAGSIGTLTEADVHRKIGERAGLDGSTVDAFIADLWEEYLGKPNTELIEYFESLHGPYLTAIISNSFVGAREKEQAAYRFGDMTDLIIYSHEVGISKPDPRIYTMTWEQLGVQPNEMLFLDDVEINITAARELGIHTILFKNNAQAITEIRALLQATNV